MATVYERDITLRYTLRWTGDYAPEPTAWAAEMNDLLPKEYRDPSSDEWWVESVVASATTEPQVITKRRMVRVQFRVEGEDPSEFRDYITALLDHGGAMLDAGDPLGPEVLSTHFEEDF